MVKHAHYRRDIKNDEIINMLKQGVSIEKIAAHFDCSYSLVQRRASSCKWKFKGRYGGKGLTETVPTVTEKKICSCCGMRPVPSKPLQDGTKLTRLCSECFRLGGKLSTIDNSWREVKSAMARGF